MSNPTTLGGNSGGLLLGLLAYPLVLSVIQHGAAGPGLWIRAKFLNQGPGDGLPLGKIQGPLIGGPNAGSNPNHLTPDTTPVPPASPRPPFTRIPATPSAPSGARGGPSVPRAV